MNLIANIRMGNHVSEKRDLHFRFLGNKITYNRCMTLIDTDTHEDLIFNLKE